MKRSVLRRKGRRDPVTSESRADIFRRDGGCVLAFLEAGHECRDVWGQIHDAHDFGRLTIEHVKSELRLGRRGELMVTLCGAANLRPPTKSQRTLFRGYLAQHPVPEPVG